MNNPQEARNLLGIPINVMKGSRDELEAFLRKLCDLGYFKNGYDEVLTHFAHDSVLLSEEMPVRPIEWGKIRYKLDGIMFCDFLRDAKIIEQTYRSVWNHFSYNGKLYEKGTNQLHYFGNKFNSLEPYISIRDDRLKCVAKSYFVKVQERQ
jgi:hypothetical protein